MTLQESTSNSLFVIIRLMLRTSPPHPTHTHTQTSSRKKPCGIEIITWCNHMLIEYENLKGYHPYLKRMWQWRSSWCNKMCRSRGLHFVRTEWNMMHKKEAVLDHSQSIRKLMTHSIQRLYPIIEEMKCYIQLFKPDIFWHIQ